MYKLDFLNSYELSRIAFGIVLLNEVNTFKNGYELLSNLLPIKIDIENSSDFFYQINKGNCRGQEGLQSLELVVNAYTILNN